MIKTILTLLLVASLALLIFNRQRIYVRDPIAAVYHNDLPHPGVEVYINYSNDVLLIEGAEPNVSHILVQDWNRKPGTPTGLTCIRWMACMTEADDATAIPVVSSRPGKYDPRVVMTSHEVTYVDGDGTAVRIELR